MLNLSDNLRRYRLQKDLTQEDIADYIGVTPQSVSKWERGENYPDITFLPALANIFETSIDTLIGMDIIRSEETRLNIHKKAIDLMERGLPLSINNKQKATIRAVLCFLYLKCGNKRKANQLATSLPHIRESRETILPLISKGLNQNEISMNIRNIIVGNDF